MKPVEEMNAMEVCAYMVALTSKKLAGKDEIDRLYSIHCVKLKKELENGGAKDVSPDFRKELFAEVDALAARRGESEKRAAGSV